MPLALYFYRLACQGLDLELAADKGQGRSWSRRGAEAICLIGCALATGRPLVAPAGSPWFAERQVEVAVSAMGKRGGRMPETSGRGWEPPHRAQPLGKSVMISLSQRG